MANIKLGAKVRDKVSGFGGVVTARSEWMNGCVRYAIQPSVGKDGKLPEVEWIDEGQLEVVKDSAVEVLKPSGGDRPAPKRLGNPAHPDDPF